MYTYLAFFLNLICVLTIWYILIEMIAIRLIALHMIIGDAGRCVAIDAGGCGKGAGWTLCVVAKFGRELMYAGEGTTKRREIHHATSMETLCISCKNMLKVLLLYLAPNCFSTKCLKGENLLVWVGEALLIAYTL